MRLFKRQLAIDDILNALLIQRENIDKSFNIEVYKWFQQENQEFIGDKKLLKYEIAIFSLWVVSLSIPSDKIKDRLHKKYCNSFDLSVEEIDVLYNDIDKRYSSFYYGYNMWASNPQNGQTLGNILIEIIINQNAELSLENTLPPINNYSLMNLNIFSFFAESLKQSLDLINKLKNDFKIPDIK